MSKNLIWTVNINNHLSDNARQSLSHAADRWNCDFLEVRTIFDNRLYPSFAKICSFEKIEGYDRCAYFDSDMLIHIEAPNPFEVFQDKSKFIAVLDIHPQNHDHNSEQWITVKNNVQEHYWHILEEQFGWGVPKNRFLDNFFNSGFYMISPKHHKTIFKAISQALPLTDVVQAYRREELLLADEKWNRLEPLINSPRMNDYVWHFTGFNFWKIKDTVKDYDWKST
jgi:hypothetical protein